MNLRKTVLTTLLALSGFAFMSASNASVIYNWVCDAADCNGDPSFSSTIEISDSAYAAGSFTGVSGNVLSWNTTSGWGDGFTLSLSDIASFLGDDINLFIALNGDGSEISDLLDLFDGTNITFYNGSIGRVDFFEGTNGNYSAGSLVDYSPLSEFANFTVQGRFVRTSSSTAVPEPSSLALLGLGLLGFLSVRQRTSKA